MHDTQNATGLQELPQLTTLRDAIQAEHGLAQSAACKAVEHAINAGNLLLQAKSLLPHGDWSQWLLENFRGSPRTARGYMLLANRLDSLDEANGNALPICRCGRHCRCCEGIPNRLLNGTTMRLRNSANSNVSHKNSTLNLSNGNLHSTSD